MENSVPNTPTGKLPKKRAPVKRQNASVWFEDPSKSSTSIPTEKSDLMMQFRKLEERFSRIEDILLHLEPEDSGEEVLSEDEWN